MEERIVVKPNTYFDSVTLMSLTQKVTRLDGVDGGMIGMGTPLNLEVLGNLGFKSQVQAGPNDLIFAFKGDGEKLDQALRTAEQMLARGAEPNEGMVQPVRNLTQALERQASNVALISVPGIYAAYEVRKALENGLHVMLFSDNVSLEDEIRLKQAAHERGLLVMGPDCGTAIINGVPLAFANRVRRGVIGIVGASGTGIQEVSVQIDRLGQGVSQVIGTGGRDLSRAVGGLMMLDGIEALRQDPETKVIVVISKPAAPEVADKVYAALEKCAKPAVYYVIGDEHQDSGNKPVRRAGNLIDTARLAVIMAREAKAEGVKLSYDVLDTSLEVEQIGESPTEKAKIYRLAGQLAGKLGARQKYIRGLFSGGTLCDEAMVELSQGLGLVYSNGPLVPEGKLSDAKQSLKHTVLDLGDDQFTVGRPHPMIDYSLRAHRLVQEAKDPETAVILLDVVLGYGSNPDPAAELIPAINQARQAAGDRELVIIAYVCGTEQDPQNYQRQVTGLESCGVVLCTSNLQAARLAVRVAKIQAKRGNR